MGVIKKTLWPILIDDSYSGRSMLPRHAKPEDLRARGWCPVEERDHERYQARLLQEKLEASEKVLAEYRAHIRLLEATLAAQYAAA